jgi:hypothetical protein
VLPPAAGLPARVVARAALPPVIMRALLTHTPADGAGPQPGWAALLGGALAYADGASAQKACLAWARVLHCLPLIVRSAPAAVGHWVAAAAQFFQAAVQALCAGAPFATPHEHDILGAATDIYCRLVLALAPVSEAAAAAAHAAGGPAGGSAGSTSAPAVPAAAEAFPLAAPRAPSPVGFGAPAGKTSGGRSAGRRSSFGGPSSGGSGSAASAAAAGNRSMHELMSPAGMAPLSDAPRAFLASLPGLGGAEGVARLDAALAAGRGDKERRNAMKDALQGA